MILYKFYQYHQLTESTTIESEAKEYARKHKKSVVELIHAESGQVLDKAKVTDIWQLE